ncbi:hypothetical protein DL95DRAFT_479692 [Leptodontidium sp. 2 PMI_412]|nr:hypothetical protein BKA61DRAFT_655335 [Leptodontidium sp. MPI-SDFR-AT-0119]KAH9208659.1 hypothetical protein DL95DRAFT_479692 [Leptodontidium sp. 2 PMI_412]
MAPEIKNVVLAGPSGSLGSHILRALLAQNLFDVTVLVRKPRDDLPSSVKVKVVDFDSVASLSEALKGKDALVDATSNPADPTLSIRLVDAAVAAGVYRILPAEFSSDPENSKARHLPPFQGKSQAYKYIQKLGRENKITWTAVSNHALFDWGLRMGFVGIDLAGKKIDYMNDGTLVIPWTLMSSVGTAVANILLRPEETRNRVCYIYDILKSQKEVADLTKSALGNEGWQEQKLDMDKVFEEAMTELQAGNVTFKVIGDMIRFSISTPGFVEVPEKDDNELLGVKLLSDEEVKQSIKQIASELL